jgi:hypothetical protein
MTRLRVRNTGKNRRRETDRDRKEIERMRSRL